MKKLLTTFVIFVGIFQFLAAESPAWLKKISGNMGPKRMMHCVFTPTKFKCTEQEKKIAKRWFGAATVATLTAIGVALGISAKVIRDKKLQEKELEIGQPFAKELSMCAGKIENYLRFNRWYSGANINDVMRAFEVYGKDSNNQHAGLFAEIVQEYAKMLPKAGNDINELARKANDCQALSENIRNIPSLFELNAASQEKMKQLLNIRTQSPAEPAEKRKTKEELEREMKAKLLGSGY